MPELKLHELIEDPRLRQAVALVDSGDVEGLRSWLSEHPGLTREHTVFAGRNYFSAPTLLEFVAENPIRHGVLPANIVAIAEVILAAGVEPAAVTETLVLVATGRVPQQCRVQVPLIDLLCDHGAEVDGALRAAALHGEREAAAALIRRGGQVTLAVAAALGDEDEFVGLVKAADLAERHAALASAAKFGHMEMVRRLLDAGEDPNRYNPAGSDAHSTPLHQAAYAGHDDVVRLLVERGARLDIKDLLWQGTAADWAHHGERPKIEAYLRDPESHG